MLLLPTFILFNPTNTQIEEHGLLAEKLALHTKCQPPDSFDKLSEAVSDARHELLEFVAKVGEEDTPPTAPRKGARRGWISVPQT